MVIYFLQHFFSSAFLVIKHYNNNNNKLNEDYYILSSNRNHLGISEQIKLFDLNGNLISKFPESNDNTCFIDTFCEKEKLGNKENLKYYIITGISQEILDTLNHMISLIKNYLCNMQKKIINLIIYV